MQEGRVLVLKPKQFKMMGLIFIMSAIIVIGTGCQQRTEMMKPRVVATETITVSAAASMKNALTEVADAYKASHPELSLTINLGGSGTLAQQIEQGAEVDVFLSASKKQMDGLVVKGLIDSDQTKDLLGNQLLVIAPRNSKLIINQLGELTQTQVKTIAVGEPKSVPVGQYAVEAFENLELLEALTPKLIYGKDVKEVLMWVETGNVDAGIVYATDANLSSQVQILAEVPATTHSPIVYPVGIIKNSNHLKTAQNFVDYLSSDEAKAIFKKYGFTIF